MDQLNNFNAKTVECVEKDFYMDDFLKPNDSGKYLLTFPKELIEMLSNCSFRLTKWLSNSNIIIHPSSKVSYPRNLIISMKELSKEF